MAISAIHIIEQQANAYFDNFANTIDDLQRLYEESGDVQALECRNRLLARYQSKPFKGAPASDNNGKSEGRVYMRGDPESKSGLNYFAPMKNLQVMLCEEWFNKVSADVKKYTKAWREKLVTDLMASEYRDKVAVDWAKSNQQLQIKGRIIGALIAAGVINKKALAVARTFYNINENTSEVKTLAKYMGDSRKEYYTDWIIEYVKQT